MKKKFQGLKRTAAFCAAIGIFTTALTGCNNNSSKVADDGKEHIKIFANFSSAEMGKGDPVIFEKIEEALNVKLDFIVPPSTNYKERLQIMLVSGDYPDLVLFPDVNDESYKNAIKNKVILPLEKYIEKAPNIKDYTYDISWKNIKNEDDGLIYGIPRTTVARCDGFVVRADWMKNVGIPVPEDNTMSITEFADMLEKFTFSDPDQNGKDDTFGFSGFVDSNKCMELLLKDQFNLLSWQEHSDEGYPYMDLIYSQNKDNYKRAMAYTQDLFKRKIIDPDSAVNNAANAADRFSSGICGVAKGFAAGVYGTDVVMREKFPDLELTYLYVENEDNEVKGSYVTTGFWGFWSVMKSAKNPELAISVLDYMLSDEGWDLILNGIEGVHYKVENNERIYDKIVTIDWGRYFVRRKDALEFFVDKKTPASWLERTEKWLKMGVDAVVLSKGGDYKPKIALEPQFMETDMKLQETVAKILTGYEEVSAYDDALDKWYKGGGEEYVKQMNDFIAKVEE